MFMLLQTSSHDSRRIFIFNSLQLEGNIYALHALLEGFGECERAAGLFVECRVRSVPAVAG